MKRSPNKPVELVVFYVNLDSGVEYSETTFHKTQSAAHERLADKLRRADETYRRYEIRPLAVEGEIHV